MDDSLNLTKGSTRRFEFCETAYFLAYKTIKLLVALPES